MAGSGRAARRRRTTKWLHSWTVTAGNGSGQISSTCFPVGGWRGRPPTPAKEPRAADSPAIPRASGGRFDPCRGVEQGTKIQRPGWCRAAAGREG